MAKIKYNHRGKILVEQTIGERSVLPGMITTFSYNNKNAFDRRPLVFVMSAESGLMSGVNFNYLVESDINKFINEIHNKIVPFENENLLRLRENYIRAQVNSRLKSASFDSKTIYDMIFPKDRDLKNAYRSYKFSIISSLKVVNYDMGKIELENQND
tara:strand:- start:262 stop:732 length:471 start_codon:yes stop_codon:yes gene_type:complete